MSAQNDGFPNANWSSNDQNHTNPSPRFDVPEQDSNVPSPSPGSPNEGNDEEKDLQQAILDSLKSEPSELEFDEAFKKALEQSIEDNRKDEQRRAWIREQQRLLDSKPGPSQTQPRPQAQTSARQQGVAPQRAPAASTPRQAPVQAQGWTPTPPSPGNHQQPTILSRSSQRSKGHGHHASSPPDGQCPICTEPSTQPTTTPCNHKFCYECLMERLGGGHDCPTCGARCGLETLAEGGVGK